nr:MAG TPA: hypothetical protein [Caudoviricetes sp.]
MGLRDPVHQTHHSRQKEKRLLSVQRLDIIRLERGKQSEERRKALEDFSPLGLFAASKFSF